MRAARGRQRRKKNRCCIVDIPAVAVSIDDDDTTFAYPEEITNLERNKN